MTTRKGPPIATNTDPHTPPKPTQRERLIAGMITAANGDGHAGATVSAVIEEAGVSRPTFYDHFADRDDCFMAALADAQSMLAERTRLEIEHAAPEDALAVAITALIGLARSHPAETRFLTNEPLGAGRLALDARDQALEATARMIETAEQGLAGGAQTPDLPTVILLGAVHRLLGNRLRRGDPGLTAIHTELLVWVGSYRRARSKQRWRSALPGAAPRDTTGPFEPALPEPPPIPRGRPRLSREEVAVNHRQRILIAVARLAEAKGYAATTVADIAREAKVDAKSFYELFTDKQDAFMNYHELGFLAVMGAMTHAFFAAEGWPERAWQAGLAYMGLLEAEPLIAHTGFVEAYCFGPQAIQRVEDSHIAFTIFLQEGYLHTDDGRQGADPPPRQLALEGIVDASYEIVYRQVRAGRTQDLSRMLGHMGAFVYPPFLGIKEANVFIGRQLKKGGNRPKGR